MSGGWTINLQSERITSYDEAHELWMKRKGYSKRHAQRLAALDDKHEEPHALDGSKKHFSLRLMSLEDKRPIYSRSSMGDHPGKYVGFELRHYAFCYHSTDCVVYREDDTIFVSSGGHPTKSANIFVSRFLPATVDVHFSAGLSTSTNPWSRNLLTCYDPGEGRSPGDAWNYRPWSSVPKRIYELAYSSVALSKLPNGGYTPTNPDVSTTPFSRFDVDKTLARQALRASRYPEFMPWARMYIHMRRASRQLKYSLYQDGRGYVSSKELLALLSEESSWPDLVNLKYFYPTRPSCEYGNASHFDAMSERDPEWLGRLHAERLGRAVRAAVYESYPSSAPVIRPRLLPFVGSLNEIEACLKSTARWEL